MTTKKTEQSNEAETLLPGPPLIGTNYELIRPRAVHPGVIGIGREFDCANGLIGKVQAITYVGEGRTRITVRSGDSDGWADLFGDFIGTVSPTGEKFHKPVFVAPEIMAARRAIEKLNVKDRATALEGFTRPPAA